MKTRLVSAILMTLSFATLGAMAATAQQEAHSSKSAMSHQHMMMANEPHHALAMAYHQSLAAFAEALRDQTSGAASVNVDFARAAATEMRRSCDQMKHHHHEHMQTMSADMHAQMSDMMQQMEVHQSELNTQLIALEQEVQSATPDAKEVSSLAAGVCTHLDAMSRKHDGLGTGMKVRK